MSYKGKSPYQYDRNSRSFNEGAWKNWPKLYRKPDGRVSFPSGPMRFDAELLRNARSQSFTTDAPRFRFNGKGDARVFGERK